MVGKRMDMIRLVEGIAAGSAIVASFVSWRRNQRTDAGKARAQSNRDRADAKHADNEERTVGREELEAAVKAQGTVLDRYSADIDGLRKQIAHLEAEVAQIPALKAEVAQCRERERITDKRIAELEAQING